MAWNDNFMPYRLDQKQLLSDRLPNAIVLTPYDHAPMPLMTQRPSP
jgi:hypothetical protein